MSDIPSRSMHGRYSRRILRKISAQQWVWSACWAVLVIGLAVTPNLWARIFAVIAFLVALIGVWPYSYGPGYTYLFERRNSRVIRKRNGRVAVESKLGSRRRVTDKEPIKVEIVAYPTAVPERDSLGVFHFTQTDADSTIVVGEAWNGANTGFQERYNAEDEFAKSILNVLNMTADSVGVIVGAHKGPTDIWRSRDWQANSIHPNVINAGRLDFAERPPTNVYERQSANLAELDLNRRLFTRDVTGFIGLSVQRPKDFPQIVADYKAGTINARQFENRMLISRMTRRLEENLKSQGLKGHRTLDEAGVRDFARKTFDLQELDTWNKLLRYPDAPDAIAMSEADKFWPWPSQEPLVLQDSQGRPYINFDGSFHRIWRATKLNEMVFPGELRPLFMSGDIGLANETSLTVSLSGMTYSASRESNALNYAILINQAIRGVFQADDKVMSLEEQSEVDALRERQDRYYFGGKQALGFNLFMSVGAVDEEGLDEADRVVQEHARSADIKLQAIPLESRQIRAFFSANLPGFLI